MEATCRGSHSFSSQRSAVNRPSVDCIELPASQIRHAIWEDSLPPLPGAWHGINNGNQLRLGPRDNDSLHNASVSGLTPGH